MECKKCGAANDDEAIFCYSCGARIDGKKVCPFCGKQIKEDSAYCSFCGKRTDGKKVCAKCGEVYEGNFCTKCGEKSGKGEELPLQPVSVEEYKPFLRLIKDSLLLAALLLLFVFSFFVGTGSIVYGSSFDVTKCDNAFYYLVKSFKDIARITKSVKDANAGYYAALYLPAVLSALVVGVNIIICAVCGGMGVSAYVKRFKENKPVRMMKYVLLPAVSTLVTYIYISRFFVSSNLYYGLFSTLNRPCVINTVLCSVIFVIVFFLQCLTDGKKLFEKNSVWRYVTMTASIVCIITVLCFADGTLLTVTGENRYGTGGSTVKLGTTYLFTETQSVLGLESGSSVPKEMKTLGNASIAPTIFVLLMFIAFSVLLYALIRELIYGDGKLWVSSVTALSLFNLISAVVGVDRIIRVAKKSPDVVCNMFDFNMTDITVKLGYAPIVAIVLSVAALVPVIIWIIRKKSEEKKNAM